MKGVCRGPEPLSLRLHAVNVMGGTFASLTSGSALTLLPAASGFGIHFYLVLK